MNQPVPAPGVPPSQRGSSEPRVLSPKWIFVTLGLLLLTTLMFSSIYNRGPRQLAEELDSRTEPGKTLTGSSDTSFTTPSTESHVSASPVTPVPSTAEEEQDLKQRLDELQQMYQLVTEELRAVREEQETTYRVERQLQTVRISRLRDLGDEIRRDLRTLKSEFAAWNARLTSLMTNDAGRLIASDPQRIRFVVGILESPAVTDEHIDRWERDLDQQLEPLDNALADETRLRLPEGFLTDLNDLKRTVREKLDELLQRQASLNAILADIPDELPESSAPTLEDALHEYHNELNLRRAESIAQATQHVEEEYRRRLAEIEEAKLQEAIADARREEEQRQAERQLNLERQALEGDFQRSLPEIRRYLTPFITPGNNHLGRGQWIYTEEKKPLSLSGIQRNGALDNTAMGHQRFMFLAGGSSNDRPSGIFPTYIGGHVHDPRDVVRAQNLLNRFGDLLVERGMLEP